MKSACFSYSPTHWHSLSRRAVALFSSSSLYLLVFYFTVLSRCWVGLPSLCSWLRLRLLAEYARSVRVLSESLYRSSRAFALSLSCNSSPSLSSLSRVRTVRFVRPAGTVLVGLGALWFGLTDFVDVFDYPNSQSQCGRGEVQLSVATRNGKLAGVPSTSWGNKIIVRILHT